MRSALSIMAAKVEPELLDLPWDQPLEEWPPRLIAALPRGISRHVVRFVHLGHRIIAIKEISEHVAVREYELLRNLTRLGAPSVTAVGVVSGRSTPDGEPLNACLITEHLSFSLPYRAVFGQKHRSTTVEQLIDGLAGLMVKLHLLGFYWGDVSLSNTLFRRDAGSYAAYLVDAETGELYDPITDGKREYDIDVARTNIIGELMDLQAGNILPLDFDVLHVGDTFAARYAELWDEITAEITIGPGENWKVKDRIHRLNKLGFDVDEISLVSGPDNSGLQMQPVVVEPGYYSRKIARLTGLQVGENQARRILNDIEEYSAKAREKGQSMEHAAHEWLVKVYEPTLAAIPSELRAKLEPAQLFHEILEHRWYISEQQKRSVPQKEAVKSFVENVLRHRRDESTFLGGDGDDPDATTTKTTTTY